MVRRLVSLGSEVARTSFAREFWMRGFVVGGVGIGYAKVYSILFDYGDGVRVGGESSVAFSVRC